MKKAVKQFVNNSKDSSAFTLLEMAIVLVIISVLLLIIVPNISRHTDSANETGDQALVQTIETQKALYALENDGPASPEALQKAGYISQDQLNRYNAIPAKYK